MGKNLGSYYEPKDEDIYFKVKRHEYLNFIERLRQTVLEAQKAGKEVVFFGD
jgi:exonuclease III